MSPFDTSESQEERLDRLKTFFHLIRNGITESNVLVNINSLDEAKAALEAIGEWNTFKPAEVFNAIEKLWPETSGLQIGFEGSPVMYVGIPLWASQIRKNEHLRRPITEEEYIEHGLDECEDFLDLNRRVAAIRGNRRLNDAEFEQIVSQVEKAFPEATEVDYHKQHEHHFPAIPFSVRIWWD